MRIYSKVYHGIYTSIFYLEELARGPTLVCRGALDPVNELGALDLRALVIRLHLPLLAIDEFPALLFDSHEALFELIATEDYREGDFIALAGSELRGQLWLVLVQEVRLKQR